MQVLQTVGSTSTGRELRLVKGGVSDADDCCASYPMAGGPMAGGIADTARLPDPATAVVAVVGLGYVGLPLMAGFAKKARTIGLDIDARKIASLNNKVDPSGQLCAEDLSLENFEFSSDMAMVSQADVVVVCVPTPVMQGNKPDYRPLLAASQNIGKHLKANTVVVYESTVDPGTTENKCIPLLEEGSSLREGVDFHVGYSPERVSPGEHARRVTDIKKIVSATSPQVTDFLEALYSRVVRAGLFKASSIKVAEAAKILENTQRDVNIALINEMMQLFDAMGIKVSEVVAAAGSKWNFHSYFPGLVGGHCISIDPYFLLNAGRRYGLSMEMVGAARGVNDRTAFFIADKLHEMLAPEAHDLLGQRVLVLGRTFKDNCQDTRNSKSYALMDALWSRGADVYSYDPIADDSHFEGGRGAIIIDDIAEHASYDAIVVTAAHDCFRQEFHGLTLSAYGPLNAPLLDLRNLLDGEVMSSYFNYWSP